MSLFSNEKVYGEKWSVKSINPVSEEDKRIIAKAQVVDSNFGLSCCFTMKSGGCVYVPMSNDANVSPGDILDVDKMECMILEKSGENDIKRIRY